MKNAWIRSCIFLYTVFVCLYIEIFCPNSVKYGTVFRRFSRCEIYSKNPVIGAYLKAIFQNFYPVILIQKGPNLNFSLDRFALFWSQVSQMCACTWIFSERHEKQPFTDEKPSIFLWINDIWDLRETFGIHAIPMPTITTTTTRPTINISRSSAWSHNTPYIHRKNGRRAVECWREWWHKGCNHHCQH